jgi:transposase-like protein
MKRPFCSTCIEGEHQPADSSSACLCPVFLRFLAWCMTAAWRTCVDWRSKRPFLTRATAHGSVVILALAVVLLGGVGIPAPRAAGEGSFGADAAASMDVASGTAVATPPPSPPLPTSQSRPLDADTVARLPVPHTTFPDRLRAEVISYIVETGDTIYDIAARFGLSPETIVWSNREGLMDAPWLIQQGLELFVLPVDGVYYTVRPGDTIAGIAADYDVELNALYNEWNDLEEGEGPREGQLLVVPGGVGEEVSWEPPPLYPSPGPAGYSYGICSGTAFTGPGANGWFILPTGSYRVSGWYFHDPRNPGHIGLDYGCNLGDPILAADSGVVAISGWNGGYGIMVELNHGNGFVTRYGHFDSVAVGCGQSVYQGDLIGYCGTTGYSTGPHLHFEIRHNGVPQDPMIYQP